MRVLHLPYNIASQAAVSVRALRAIGVDARGVVVASGPMDSCDELEVLPAAEGSKFSPHGLRVRLSAKWQLLAALQWADVVHWHFCVPIFPFQLFAVATHKARLVEFWGSDIRIPEIASADNRYTAEMYRRHPWLGAGKKERSLRNQALFGSRGFAALSPDVELDPYVQRECFPAVYSTRARVMVEDFVPRYPDPSEQDPLILHMPSNKDLKGTEQIVAALGRLEGRVKFRFRMIHNVEHAEALRILSESDIMIDEIVSGAYGLAAIESMSFGKPTVGFSKQSLLPLRPAEFPLVNANADDIGEVVERLIRDGGLRHEIGRRSRAFAEKYHDARTIARDHVRIYEELLANKRRSRGTRA